mmetsp:Transcript_14899/g.44919  ORF Transcript_14899/g.44919 Transcript_14899/m.44919 type:complete len:223 (+) Transcript_14899:847-1515(+)
MDSSICVATMTGLPASRHMLMMRFWMTGTSYGFISTPRSPRATMMPSEYSRISSSTSTACGFSILARIFTLSPTRPRSSAMSSAFCTKESATQSTSNSSACSRSARSLGVSGEMGMEMVGVFTPLRSERSPPISTRQSTKPSPLPVTVICSLPSSSSTVSSTLSVFIISGCGMETRVSSPSSSVFRSKRKSCPSLSTTFSANLPTRCFGPCRSARMQMGWSY